MIKPILIPTEITKKNTNIVLVNGKLKQCIKLELATYKNIQDIILVDPEAEIVEGDWKLVDKSIFKNKKDLFISNKSGFKGKQYKMISSTNKSHNLPQLSPQSIQLLINYYNEHKYMPESIEVEKADYESWMKNGASPVFCKLNQQGEVDITIPEINKTIDENLLYTFLHYLHHGTETRFYDSFESIVESFKNVKPNYTKEKLYTEEEVEELCYSAMKEKHFTPLCVFRTWFEQNKKK